MSDVGRPLDAQPNTWDEAHAVHLVRDDKFVHGADGWLFLANDANDVLGQHAGQCRLSAEALERWHATLEERIDFLSRMGVPYFFLVAPDTHAVYSEKLPPSFEPADQRPIHQLMRHLTGRGSRARLIYPLDELRAAKAEGLVCTPVDTHWTDYGAFVAYTRLFDEIEATVPVRRLSERDVQIVDTEAYGDLGFKAGRTGPTATVRFTQTARLVSDNLVESTGSYVVTECPDAPPTRCVFVADSYGTELARFMGESFERLAFIQAPTLDRAVIERERPDVVVSLMAERFMIVPPDDREAPSLADRERAKRDGGRVRPTVALWEPRLSPKVAAPAEVERIRADLLAQARLQDATLVSALAYAGLRGREALALTWESVGEDAIEIVARPLSARTAARRSRLGSGEARTIRLLRPLAEDLDRWRLDCGAPHGGPVFRNDDGSPWSADRWRAWARGMYGATGTSPHDLRWTFGALLLQEGIAWPAVAAELGEERDELPGHYGKQASNSAVGAGTAKEQIRRARSLPM
jgi:alginate O-acetyltransferase complex protein AlgJ